MVSESGFTFANFLIDVIAIFAFVLWFWLIITVLSDLIRRTDISGWGKAIWVIVLILIPYLGVLAYMISQGPGMAMRNSQQTQQTRDELRRAVGFSIADEIQKLDGLRKAGSITEDHRGGIQASSRQADSVGRALEPATRET